MRAMSAPRTTNEIHTERLILRPHRVADYDAYLQIWTQPDPSPFAFQLDAENTWYRLLRWVGHWTHFGYGLFVLEDRASGALLGEAGFAHFRRFIDGRFDTAPEAAWRVVQSRRGEGLAAEAMDAALEWFEAQSRASRTVCLIHPTNAKSLRLADRLGFVEYGRAVYREETNILLERSST